MEAKLENRDAYAKVKMVRIAPRKVRLVVDLIRGKDIKEAKAILNNTNKKSTFVVSKLLDSAIANAVNNHELNEDNLYIKMVQVNEGPRLKRFIPRAKGSASSLVKRTSHITLVLSERN
jgi:large subunit ribosomal protein L22